MTRLSLWFLGGETPQLEELALEHALIRSFRVCRRGKTSGALPAHGTFHWSVAVRAFAVLALRTAAAGRLRSGLPAVLSGGAGSLAASLDYALSKQPLWLADLFGMSAEGSCYSRRFFKRTNPERRRPGPVILAFNERVLPEGCIEVWRDGQPVAGPERLLKMADAIERAPCSRRRCLPAAIDAVSA